MATVATWLAGAAKSIGVDVVFGYPGQSNLVLLHEFRNHGLRYIQMADERGAGFAAIGYAQSSGRPSIVCVSKGPAATNLLTPLVAAASDGVPLIVITGNVPVKLLGTNSFQEFDPASAFKAAGAVKDARQLKAPAAVAEVFSQLVRVATMEVPGPVLLDIPMDLLNRVAALLPAAVRLWPSGEPAKSAATLRAIRAACAHVRSAAQPVVIVGRGARAHFRQIRAFVRRHRIPVVHTVGGTGVVATDDPCYGGLLRHNGSANAARLVIEADVILALGTGLDERATCDPTSFGRHAFTIHVDVDGTVLRRRATLTDLRINTSIQAFLTAATEQLSNKIDFELWLTQCHRGTDATLPQVPSVGPLKAVEIVSAALSASAASIVVKDSGSHKYWTTNRAPCVAPDHAIASCHFGAMGFAIPAAIGAAIARPGTQVIAACGDGGAWMSLAELLTAVRSRCDNLKIVVFNNGGLGSTRDYEDAAGLAPSISNFGGHLPLGTFATAVGIQSYRIAAHADLSVMQEALERPGLMLFDCIIDAAESMRPSVSYLEPLGKLVEDSTQRRGCEEQVSPWS